MPDPLAQFPQFCANLRIVAKDKGEVPLILSGTQREFVRRVRKAISEDIHWIVVLKARQTQVSTISLALDLYWPAKFQNVQGGLVTESDTNRDVFRSTLTQYYSTLPPAWKIEIARHNRVQLLYANGSRLSYAVAGTKLKAKGGNLGQGQAWNYAHFTEVSSYGDPDDFERALGAVLAEQFPNRLYIFESTAKGYNHFYDMWQTAKRSPGTQAAIFLPWWLLETYRAPEGSSVLRVYGGYEADGEEREWMGDVEKLYGHVISPAQLAWWRWKLHEQFEGNVGLLHQEYPPDEKRAFQTTGSTFFSNSALSKGMERIKMLQETGGLEAKGFRYAIGSEPMDIMVHSTPMKAAHLRIYKPPVAGGVYVLGADPAYGSSETADQFAICVLRCWGDKVEQVAEFSTPSMTTIGFAWVIVHLAGYYNSALYNLEINGPGQAVLNEIENIMRRKSEFSRYMTGRSNEETFVRPLAQIGVYLYRRMDSIGGGYAKHTKTNFDVKARFMNALRDTFELGHLFVNSPGLLKEMRTIVNDGGSIAAHGRAKDDKVVAVALALIAWKDMRQDMLRKRKVFWQADVQEQQARAAAEAARRDRAGVVIPVPYAQFLHPSLRRALSQQAKRDGGLR